MENDKQALSEPVTALVVRTVKPGRAQDFEQWVQGMPRIARKFDGFLGSNVIRPRDPAHPDYVIIARFDQYEHLKAFMSSPERQEYIRQSEEMTVGDASIQEMHGFESFFNLPGEPTASKPPAMYKMAVLTMLVLYPLLLGVSTLIGILFRGYPRPVLILLTLLVMVPAMTYFIMPWVTRLFRFWLYPKATAG